VYGTASASAHLVTKSPTRSHLSQQVEVFVDFSFVAFLTLRSQLYISAFSPILWYMWVQSGMPSLLCLPLSLNSHRFLGTGNSNFYYALTLAQAVASGWLVSNLLSAILEHDYRRKHNLPAE
jgi:hypothetical protein